MPDLVSSQQTIFIWGWEINDKILLAKDCVCNSFILVFQIIRTFPKSKKLVRAPFWVSVCLLKKERGLRVLRLVSWNQASMLKHIGHTLFDDRQSMWSSYRRTELRLSWQLVNQQNHETEIKKKKKQIHKIERKFWLKDCILIKIRISSWSLHADQPARFRSFDNLSVGFGPLITDLESNFNLHLRSYRI